MFDSSVLVEGDAFFGFVARGAIEPWLPASRDQNEVVTQAAASAVARYVSGGYTTVFDGIVGPWFLPTFAVATGLDLLDYVILLPAVDVCVERVEQRRGHGFADESVTRKMHHEFEQADIDPRHLFLEPPDQPDDVADLIVSEQAAGAVSYRTPAHS